MQPLFFRAVRRLDDELQLALLQRTPWGGRRILGV
jgi:hypothetical protein